jgi:glucose-6-phosphate 1-dehydrogenase
MTPSSLPPCDAVVLFGATGDLAAKMIFPALAGLRAGGVALPIVAVTHAPMSAAALLARASERHAAAEPDVARAVQALAPHVRTVAGDLADAAVYAAIGDALGASAAPLHYLAIPPQLFGSVVEHLAPAGVVRDGRVAIEKPFGHDLASARALERTIEAALPRSVVLRVDHFLGKDPLRNLAWMRHATAWLEPLWSAAHVKSVQVTMAEDFGLDGRGAFYEKVGALRDVFQNHLLELAALIAMEPASPADPAAFNAARLEALRAIAPIAPGDVVYGQFASYRAIADVAPQSQVPTYLATRIHVESPRFAGVPFAIRAGKRLPLTTTMASLNLIRTRPLHEAPAGHPPDALRFRLGPGAVEVSIDTHRLAPRTAGTAAPLTLCGALPRDHDRDAYVNLLGAAIRGDASMSEDAPGVTAAWRIVDDVLHADIPVHPYADGSWGPAEAEHLLPPGERWYDPPPERA